MVVSKVGEVVQNQLLLVFIILQEEVQAKVIFIDKVN